MASPKSTTAVGDELPLGTILTSTLPSSRVSPEGGNDEEVLLAARRLFRSDDVFEVGNGDKPVFVRDEQVPTDEVVETVCAVWTERNIEIGRAHV